MRLIAATLSIALLATACGGGDTDISSIDDLPEATTASVAALLDSSERPVVLNVWASWCVPCRSEAPLLERAANAFAGRVRFVGLNFRDRQDRARSFIGEFFTGAPIDHFFDSSSRIPVDLGGTVGVPQTFFYAAGGELVAVHAGVIDERTLALQIDEILARSR